MIPFPWMLHGEAVAYLMSLAVSARLEWLGRYGLLHSALAAEVLPPKVAA